MNPCHFWNIINIIRAYSGHFSRYHKVRQYQNTNKLIRHCLLPSESNYLVSFSSQTEQATTLFEHGRASLYLASLSLSLSHSFCVFLSSIRFSHHSLPVISVGPFVCLRVSLSPSLSLPSLFLSLSHYVCFFLQFALVIIISLLSLSVRLSVCVYLSLSISLWLHDIFLHSEHERHEIMYTTIQQDMFLVKSTNNSCPLCRRARYHEICNY